MLSQWIPLFKENVLLWQNIRFLYKFSCFSRIYLFLHRIYSFSVLYFCILEKRQNCGSATVISLKSVWWYRRLTRVSHPSNFWCHNPFIGDHDEVSLDVHDFMNKSIHTLTSKSGGKFIAKLSASVKPSFNSPVHCLLIRPT